MKSLVTGIAFVLLSQASQAAICNATVPLNRYFSGGSSGTELLNAAQIMRQANLGTQGNVLTNLAVAVQGQAGQSAILAWKYSQADGISPAPGRTDVPSGPALNVQPYYGEQIINVNYDNHLSALNLTLRANPFPGETSARYYRVNGAGQAIATKAYITVRTLSSRCR